MKTKTYGLQQETRQYLRRLYAYGRELCGEDIADIDNFVKGLKQLNLWGNTVCWPMRSIHNIGTGSTVLSLGGGGRYDGTMVNSPTWGVNGTTFGAGVVSQINYPSSMLNFVKNDLSVMGITNKHGQDNACIYEYRGAAVTSFYVNFTSNDNTVSQACIPCTTRGITNYYQTNRGGTVPSGNTCVSCSFLNTSQSSYKNGVLIVNDTGLATRSAVGVATNFRTGAGNVRAGDFIVPIVIAFNCGVSSAQHLNSYNLLKATIGKNLGLL